MDAYLLITGDRVPLGWGLEEQRMAFAGFRRGTPRNLEAGDALLPYTTRCRFRNLRKDRGLAISSAWTRSAPDDIEPVVIGEVSYPVGCDIELVNLPKVRAWSCRRWYLR